MRRLVIIAALLIGCGSSDSIYKVGEAVDCATADMLNGEWQNDPHDPTGFGCDAVVAGVVVGHCDQVKLDPNSGQRGCFVHAATSCEWTSCP